MLREMFIIECANLLLNEWYHENEANKGIDFEFNEKCARDTNIKFNQTRVIMDKILGRAEGFSVRLEARNLAKKAFEEGKLYID